MWQERSGYRDDPLGFLINLLEQSETRTAEIVREFAREDVNPLKEVMSGTMDELRRSDTSRRVTYKSINREIPIHCMYV